LLIVDTANEQTNWKENDKLNYPDRGKGDRRKSS